METPSASKTKEQLSGRGVWCNIDGKPSICLVEHSKF